MDPTNNFAPKPNPEPKKAPAAPSAMPILETGPAAALSFENAFEGGAAIAGQQSAHTVQTAFSQFTPNVRIGATEPLTTPDPIPEPDPVEEALRAPIKPAAPVPGSIGSAVSVPVDIPTEDTNSGDESPFIQDVDPNTPFVQDATPVVAKKTKEEKSNLILTILIAISAIVLVVLAVILIMQLTGADKKIGQSTSGNTPSANVVYSELNCKYSYNSAELLTMSNATSGRKTLNATFGDGELLDIEEKIYLNYENSSLASAGKNSVRDSYVSEFKSLGISTDPFKSEYKTDGSAVEISHRAEINQINETNMSMFHLVLAKDRTIDISTVTIQKTYKNLGYTCSVEIRD